MKNNKNIINIAWPIIVILVFITIYFYKILFLKKIYLVGDLYYHYFSRVLISNAIKDFSLPFWVPFINCGFPLMANIEAGVFDPISLLFLYLFNPHTAFNLLICVYFFIAGLFTFLFCKSLKLSSTSSLFAAIIYMFGGFFSAHLVHLPVVFAAAYLPLTFLAINLYFKNKQIRYIILTGVSLGMSFLPGHPQIAIYSIFAAILYFLLRCISDIKGNYKLRKSVIYSFLIIIVLITAFGLAAIQILPTSELTHLSTRSEVRSFQGARTISLYFNHLITYLFPYFFGKDEAIDIMDPYWGRGSFWEVFIYIGIFPLCFFTAAFSYCRRDNRIKHLVWLYILFLLLALGKNSPVFFLAYYIILPFRYFSNPCRFIFVSTFTSAILAGLGLDFVLSDGVLLKKMARILFIFTLLLIAAVILLNVLSYSGTDLRFIKRFNIKNIHNQLTLFFFITFTTLLCLRKNQKIKNWFFKTTIITVTFMDLLIVGCLHNIPADQNLVINPPESVNFLKKDKEVFRAYLIGVDFPYGTQIQKTRWTFPYFSGWGIESANLTAPLWLRNYFFLRDFEERFLYGRDGYFPIDDYLDMFGVLNVKYIVSSVDLKSKLLKFLFDDGRVKIYQNPNFQHRVYFITAQEVINNEHSLKRKLFSGISVLEKFLKKNNAKLSETKSDKLMFSHRINILPRFKNDIVIKIENLSDGFLVLSETMYPGWKAFVDGKEEEILTVNQALRAVFLKKGEHCLKFIYRPKSVRIGFLVSIVFCFISLIIISSPLGSKKINLKI